MTHDRHTQKHAHEPTHVNPSAEQQITSQTPAGLNPRQIAVLNAQQTLGNAAVRRKLVQRVPDPNPTVPPVNTTQGNIEDILVWTIPDLSSEWATASASAIEAQGHTQSFVDNNQMAEAGWNAMTGTQVTGTDGVPAELKSVGTAGRADANAAEKSIDSALASRTQAAAKVSAVRNK